MALPSWHLAGALLRACAGTRRARRISEALAVGRAALPICLCLCRRAGDVVPLSLRDQAETMSHIKHLGNKVGI